MADLFKPGDRAGGGFTGPRPGVAFTPPKPKKSAATTKATTTKGLSALAQNKVVPGRGGGATGARMGAPQQQTPMEAFMEMAAGFQTGGGGGGGGGRSGGGGGGGSAGNGAAVAALVAAINEKKANAQKRYANNGAQITDLYGQLRDSLKPNEAMTKARYDGAIGAVGQIGSGIASENTQQIASQNAERDSALQSLGVSAEAVAAAPSQQAVADQQGQQILAENNGSWGNMMGVMSNAQQSRDRLDVQGATDAGVLANRQLTESYELYNRDLDQEMAQARASFIPATSGGGGGGGGGRRSGGGGGGGAVKNPWLDALYKRQQKELLDDIFAEPEPVKPFNTKPYVQALSKITKRLT